MIAFHLQHMAFQPRALTRHSRLDMSCEATPAAFQPLVDAIGDVTTHHRCVQCPAHLCKSMDDFLEFARTLPQYQSLDELPAEWQGVFAPVMDVFRAVDVLVVASGGTHDEYVLHIARFANAAIVRFSDLTTRARLAPRLTPGTRVPVDALLAPSLYVGLHPYVVNERIPTYVVPGAVDSAAFSRARVLKDSDSGESQTALDETGVPAHACGGEYRRRMCDLEGPESPWCSPLFVFGFLARLSPEKGVGLFLSAAAEVTRSLPLARFVMIGSTAQHAHMDALQALRARANLTHSVRVVAACLSLARATVGMWRCRVDRLFGNQLSPAVCACVRWNSWAPWPHTKPQPRTPAWTCLCRPTCALQRRRSR